jgi:hypothetical protein
MTVNPYFRRNKKGEQALVEALTTEAIKIHGHEMIYIPRETVTEDLILGEEISRFRDANRIEMYFDNPDGFEGDDEMSRFGLNVVESATFVVSRKRFMEVMGHNEKIREIGRPREGDLIYFDYPSAMFEIKFVHHENPFYPLGDRYSFKLICEEFKSSSEEFATGESAVDDLSKNESEYLYEITLGSGSGTFKVGERVYTQNGTARKVAGTIWTVGNGTITVNRISGVLEAGDTIVGETSGAEYTISAIGETDTRVPNADAMNNDEFELEKNNDDIFDFTERDPFSEGNY